METFFLTYEEAAERLNIKPDSVRRRARLKKWPRREGNDGRTRVGIPADLISPDNPPGPPPGPSPDTRVAELEVEVRMLREIIDDLRTDKDRARADAEAQREMLRAALDHMKNRPSIWARLFRS